MSIKVRPILLSKRGSEGALFADGSFLAIGAVVAYAKHYNNEALKQHFDFVQLVQHCKPEWDTYLKQAEEGPAVWLLSCYMWNNEENLEMAAKIKAISPDSLMILGGPHVPKYHQECEQFFIDNPAVDIAVRAEGEITLAKTLEAITQHDMDLHCDLSHIEGITFRTKDNQLVRTPDRPRNRDLDDFPSPFLTGEFDHESFNDLPGMILETNRGCPYGCTFCDWGAATLQKVSLFDIDRLRAELDFIGSKKPSSLYIADANFGAFKRDIEIAEALVATKQKYGFPQSFACNYTKHPNPRLAEIIKVLNEGGLISSGIISMQSTDLKTLEAIERSNIKSAKYETLIDIFREEKLKLSSELMIGLPGQTYESHKEDLQFFVDRKLMTVIYNTQLMPNAPMNEPSYREKFKIKTDEKGYVIASSSFSEQDLASMEELFLAFQLFYVLGLLKYYLYYMQIEHDVRVMDFLERYLQETGSNENTYPIGYQVKNRVLKLVDEKRVGMPILNWYTDDASCLFDNLNEFYHEIIHFTNTCFGVELPASVVQTLLAAQRAVMPELGKQLPMTVELDHNLVSYFDQIKKLTNVQLRPDDFKPLESFPPGSLKVNAIKPKTIDNLALVRMNQHNNAGWELKSPLRFY